MNNSRVAIVTGGNKGVGFEIVRGLIKANQVQSITDNN